LAFGGILGHVLFRLPYRNVTLFNKERSRVDSDAPLLAAVARADRRGVEGPPKARAVLASRGGPKPASLPGAPAKAKRPRNRPPTRAGAHAGSIRPWADWALNSGPVGGALQS
jgi:hypothetical protein